MRIDILELIKVNNNFIHIKSYTILIDCFSASTIKCLEG